MGGAEEEAEGDETAAAAAAESAAEQMLWFPVRKFCWILASATAMDCLQISGAWARFECANTVVFPMNALAKNIVRRFANSPNGSIIIIIIIIIHSQKSHCL